jgi:hypothetical protein
LKEEHTVQVGVMPSHPHGAYRSDLPTYTPISLEGFSVDLMVYRILFVTVGKEGAEQVHLHAEQCRKQQTKRLHK